MDHFAFCEVGVPGLFFGDGCVLAEGREGDLTSAVFDSGAPCLCGLETGGGEGGVEGVQDLESDFGAEEVGEDGLPI